jgi:hypothetical protein
MDSVYGPWTTGGASPRWTVDRASMVAHRSLASRPLRATVACCESGHAKGVRRCDQGTAHQSSDGGEEATRW